MYVQILNKTYQIINYNYTCINYALNARKCSLVEAQRETRAGVTLSRVTERKLAELARGTMFSVAGSCRSHPLDVPHDQPSPLLARLSLIPDSCRSSSVYNTRVPRGATRPRRDIAWPPLSLFRPACHARMNARGCARARNSSVSLAARESERSFV